MTKVFVEETVLFLVRQNLLYSTKDKDTESTRKENMHPLSTQSAVFQDMIGCWGRFIKPCIILPDYVFE